MSTSKNNKTINIVLWIAQILLAALFLMAGIMKSTTPIDEMSKTIIWTKDLPILVRFIGISELLAGIGLLLPSILRIKPILTPIAAAGLVIIMVLAIIYHITRNEMNVIGMNFVFLLVAAFIAWGRFKKVPIKARN